MADAGGRAEVLVLGAGIAGLALASHLARRDVTTAVVDPRPRGAGATGRAAGIVTEQLWNAWDVEVTREAHAEARRLLAGPGPRTYWANGFLRFTRDLELGAAVRAAADRLRGWGVDAAILDAREIRELLPFAVLPEGTTGIYSENDACLTPSALAEAYAAAAQGAGAAIHDGVGDLRVARDGTDWTVVTAGGTLRAPRLVVAAGAWSKRLLLDLGGGLPLCPYRTQAALLLPSPAPEGDFPSVHDLDGDVYVRPELSGRILAGDGTEPSEADPERFAPGGDPEFVGHLAEVLEAPFPGWASATLVAAWAGVCTATPDRRPLVGPVPGVPGLFVMTGFNGFGVMRAGGVASLFARALEAGGDAPGPWAPLAPVRPDRFPAPARPFAPRPGFTLEAGDEPRC